MPCRVMARTKLPLAAVKTTSAFWGTAVEKCSL